LTAHSRQRNAMLEDAPTITLCQQNRPLPSPGCHTPHDLSRSSIWH
jgi:hypothetical protein